MCAQLPEATSLYTDFKKVNTKAIGIYAHIPFGITYWKSRTEKTLYLLKIALGKTMSVTTYTIHIIIYIFTIIIRM